MRLLVSGAIVLVISFCRGALGAEFTAPLFPLPEDAESLDAQPMLGAPSPFRSEPTFSTVIASAQIDSAYYARYKGILFTVAVSRERRISYIATSDSSFHSPEGIHVGSSVGQAHAAGAGELFREPGWACHSKLPSGWYVATALVGDHMVCDDKVSFLFKR
jgi:hypothetical protein